MVTELFRFYDKFHKQVYNFDGSPIHDAVAVAHVVRRRLSGRETATSRSTSSPSSVAAARVVDIWRGADREPNCARRRRHRRRRLPRPACRAHELVRSEPRLRRDRAARHLAPRRRSTGADATHAALAELGRRFDAAAPETTIVLTPHNVHVEGHFAVVLAGTLAGRAGGVRRAGGRALVPGRPRARRGGRRRSARRRIPVVGASFGANDPGAATAPMDWGVLIPLWHMGGRSDPPVPAVVVSPARDRPLEEHVRAGRRSRARRQPDREARRADRERRPRTRARPGRSLRVRSRRPRSTTSRWCGSFEENRLGGLLELDPAFVDAAKADSWWQLLMLHGALGDGWNGEFLSYESIHLFRDALCRLCT